MNRARENLTFCQDCKTIAEISHVVFSLNFISEARFMTLVETKMTKGLAIRNAILILLLTSSGVVGSDLAT